MKPITHPLAIAYVEAAARWTAAWRDPFSVQERARFDATTAAWADAGFPLYADPTPMPAPALGMRVWRTFQQGDAQRAAPCDITSVRTGKVWADFDVNEDEITHIVDSRTGEVLWRRS